MPTPQPQPTRAPAARINGHAHDHATMIRTATAADNGPTDGPAISRSGQAPTRAAATWRDRDSPAPYHVHAAGDKAAVARPSTEAAANAIVTADRRRPGTGYVHRLRHRGVQLRITQRRRTAGNRLRQVTYDVTSPRLSLDDVASTTPALTAAVRACLAAADAAGLLQPPGGPPGDLL